ncbi:MAG: hypothetical protein ACRDBP_05290 [Luteolibacter sp.]
MRTLQYHGANESIPDQCNDLKLMGDASKITLAAAYPREIEEQDVDTVACQRLLTDQFPSRSGNYYTGAPHRSRRVALSSCVAPMKDNISDRFADQWLDVGSWKSRAIGDQECLDT